MHTEHLQNVRMGHVAGGWLVAIAVTSLAVFVLEALGFSDGGVVNGLASGLAVLVGFGAGGMFAGFRSMRAPILHGVGMGVLSVSAWALVNLVGVFQPQLVYGGVTAPVLAALMFVQFVAAMVGALVGYNLALRGRPGLREDLPEAG